MATLRLKLVIAAPLSLLFGVAAMAVATAAAPASIAPPPVAAAPVAVVAPAPSPDPSPARAAPPLVQSVEGVLIPVSDIDRSVAFFRDVLTFTVAGDEEISGPEIERLAGVFGARVRSVRLRLGRESIVLSQFLTPRGRPVPPDMRSNDLAFQHIAIVVSDMERAYARLRKHHVRHLSTGPQTLPAWNRGAAGIKAFYFADPDDHALEIIWFPSGKGDPRWQAAVPARTSPLFLGIDHTAIGVSDTARSLRFYRDTLGLRVAGESENYGTEQEHLNNVEGAHLRITGLRAPRGIGIEFLEYLAPRDGRPAPADARANDLGRWHTILRVADVSTAAAQVPAGAVVELRDPVLGAVREATAQDPDRHGLLFEN